MVPDEKEYDYESLKIQGTGTQEELEDYKVITYQFDKYRIKIKLGPANEFLGILEIKIDKDFLSHQQKITIQGVHDVDEFYRE